MQRAQVSVPYILMQTVFLNDKYKIVNVFVTAIIGIRYEGISKSFEPNMERARNLDLFCFIFQRSPLPTPHTCPI